MRIKKISLRNIRSYREEVIDFPEGSLLLGGDIGSGKTTILLAIEYALFGLQPGQRGIALLRNDASEGSVVLELESDSKDIVIERRLKRTNKTVSNDYASLTIDGEKFESSVTEIKTKILEVLGYPHEFIKKNNLLYKYTLYTPQEQMKNIILEDSETRLNIIRHIFGIDKYRRIRENLSILTSFLKDESKEMQREIATLEEDKVSLESLRSFLLSLNDRIKTEEEKLKNKYEERKKIEEEILNLEEKLRERDVIERELEKTKILVSTKRENLTSLNNEIEEIIHSLKDHKPFNQEELDKALENIKFYDKNLEKLNSEYVQIVSSIHSLKEKEKENFQKRERIFKIEICPTCLQDVSETHKHNIMNETESLMKETERKMRDLDERKRSILKQIEAEKNARTNEEEKKTYLEVLKSNHLYVERSRRKLDSLQKSKSSLETDLKMLESHIINLKEGLLKFSPLKIQFNKKKEFLTEAFRAEKEVEISIAELGKEKQLTEKQISDLSDIIQKKEVRKSKLSSILELNDWLSNQFLNLIDYTERNVLIKLRMQFSQLFSRWFHTLVNSDTLDVRLDESFTPLIISEDAEMDYTFLSGGERTAVALAYRLALNQTINSLFAKIKTRDIVILDEPTDGFSEAQVSKLRDVLEDLDVSQLIIVSHEQKIEGFVDNIIKVTKEDGSSRAQLITSKTLSQP